jgi:3-hydroxy-9,10-secoandrosta-1,3,5(10)-triene-9,17-dione monooxygenase reductase component
MTATFRQTLGEFVTGVTVVTARRESERVGITANSFNSVSLEPPLILVSLARTLRSFDAFASASRFGVSLLSAEQSELARRFASSASDKWSGIVEAGSFIQTAAPPRIPGSTAFFDCEVYARYDGGDHEILVGRVLHFDRGGGAPLVYHRGRFTALAQGESHAA